VRVAIAVAQGWQLAVGAKGIKLLGISSAETLAALAQEEGMAGRVAVAIDAQRNEFYLADYELDATGWRALTPLRLATLAEVQAREAAGEIIVGPEVGTCFPRGRLLIPRAATLGGLAVGRTDFIPGEKLEPIYLRETKFVKAPPRR
jgi:tRNA A37 threonylcarbamoyladenosine modification protein TsaB